MEEVEAILRKGQLRLTKDNEIRLSRLKKLLKGESDLEEVQAFVGLMGPVEQREGKKSYQYINKIRWKLYIAKKSKSIEKKNPQNKFS